MEMENSTSAEGFISRVLPPSDGVSGLVEIGFLLRDTLNIVEVVEDVGSIRMSQCCYEQTIISMDSSEVDDEECVEEKVREALLEMHKNLHTEESECPEVERIIPAFVHVIQRNNPSFGTLSLEIRIDSVTDKSTDHRPATPTGEHGLTSLLRRSAENCPVCLNDYSSSPVVVVTTCHHAFHKACIFRWLHERSESCPVCRFNLAPMTGPCRIQFD